MPTMPERMQHLETLLEDPELGLISHVKRVESKLDILLEERADHRPFIASLKYAGTAFVGAVTFWLANFLLPAAPTHHS